MRAFIESAMLMRGELSVFHVVEGQFVARMKWPHVETSLVSEPRKTLELALDSLEDILIADAGDEMRESGAV